MKALRLLLLWCIAISAAAQNFSLRGNVSDAQSRQPVPRARVEILQGRDTAALTSALTAADGRFALVPRRAGEYTLRVSCLGYRPQSRKVRLTGSRPRIDTLHIRLAPDDIVLSEATVTALSRLLTVKEDTMEFHTDALRLPPGSSLSVAIKQLPGFELDKDGKLTYLGKEVKSVLVGGKEFFGDIQTALANMPADAVENISTYEKTDEAKQFSGRKDNDKSTVIDLKIKKEYLASWNINADMAYGTEERYLAKGFASTFTDRRRLALFGSVNNVSENQQVDDNGNWRYYVSPYNGLYTYRKAGGLLSWDNGKKNTEGGMLRARLNADFTHNTGTHLSHGNTETFLPDGSGQFSYDRVRRNNTDRRFFAAGSMSWNIDSLKRLDLGGDVTLSDGPSRSSSIGSAYDERPSTDDPASGLHDAEAPEELKAHGIYSQRSDERATGERSEYRLSAGYTHMFVKDKHGIEINARVEGNDNDRHTDRLYLYRYLRPDAPRPDLFNRQYEAGKGNRNDYKFRAGYYLKLNSQLSLEAGYEASHTRQKADAPLYRLDRYERYASALLPVGARPSTADSLAAVIDLDNSRWKTYRTTSNKGTLALGGDYGKVDFRLYLDVNGQSEKLSLRQGDDFYPSSRHTLYVTPIVNLKWNFVKGGDIRIRYEGYKSRPDLESLLPIADSKNEMNIRRNNPHLKDSWTNWINLQASYFNRERGDSYGLYANFSHYSNAVYNTLAIDPVTGARVSSQANTNGNYSGYMMLSTEQPLDTARHWTASIRLSGLARRERSYIGTTPCSVNNYGTSLYSSLRYRNGIWSATLRAGYDGSYSRYSGIAGYDQNGHTYDINLAPQVELPFGMKVGTDFGLWGRRGYDDDLLNHDQWLWNLNISQTFLRSKALTVRFEWVDILRQRTSELNTNAPYERYFMRIENFLSYALLHVVYNFNIKGKGRS